MGISTNLPGQTSPGISNSSANTPRKKSNNYFDGLQVTKKHLFLFFIIILSYFFEQLDNNNFSFVAPAIIKSWGVSQGQIAHVTSLYFLGMTCGGLVGGIISDLIGRRKSFLGAILIFSSMSVVNGLTSDFSIFMISRALTGFGIFCMMVVSVAYLSEMAPGESRGKWQSLTAAGGFCAMPVIGLISRAIIPMSPEAWRIIFYIGGIGFIGFLLGLIYLKESPRWLVAKGKISEAEKVVEDLTGIAVDLSEAARNVPKKLKTSEQFIGMFSGKYLRRTIILLLIGIPINVGTFATQVWTPTLLNMKGFTLVQSLSVGTASMLGGPVGIFLSSFVSDKGGRKIPIGIGTLFLVCMTIIFAGLGNTYMATMLVGFLMNAAIMGTGFISMAYVPEHYPTKMRNTSVGFINACQRLGVSGSQLFIPTVMAAFGFKSLFMGIAGLYIFSALVVLLLGERTGGKSLEEVD
ncbi:MFS transporter [Desulfosporosinus sp. PR]|uniref:MFS transporter n=1 Tax=Candidatus Desulfosporosinus nitrosoreducens TaxID=3401928 RepID=UPI0027EEABA9|nr:MFS transporter [Desulfosporosinus sp. PR]MDQ7094590.1 MFS transporter [Desulfosporosinus sp. PR]